jgi:CheY-like chemotaxis protein
LQLLCVIYATLKVLLIKPIQQAELLKAIRSALGAAAAGEASTANPSAAAAAPTQRTLKILLAEDNQVNQMLAFKVLTKRGHEVVVANNGREALDAWRTHRFDAILMDVQMPEMDGVEATQAIRAEEQESGQHTPIIALTAHAMKGDRERFLAVGMDAFVAKPLRTEELLTTLTRLTFHAAANVKTSANSKPAQDASCNGQTPPIPPTEDEAILDRAITLARVEGDYDLLQALISMIRRAIVRPPRGDSHVGA